jgi:hypothetical protein
MGFNASFVVLPMRVLQALLGGAAAVCVYIFAQDLGLIGGHGRWGMRNPYMMGMMGGLNWWYDSSDIFFLMWTAIISTVMTFILACLEGALLAKKKSSTGYGIVTLLVLILDLVLFSLWIASAARNVSDLSNPMNFQIQMICPEYGGMFGYTNPYMMGYRGFDDDSCSTLLAAVILGFITGLLFLITAILGVFMYISSRSKPRAHPKPVAAHHPKPAAPHPVRTPSPMREPRPAHTHVQKDITEPYRT